ncbi:MAG: RNA polymerase sigma factor [Cryomorphaceae bacterium]
MQNNNLANATLEPVKHQDHSQQVDRVKSLHEDALARCVKGDHHAQMQIYHMYYKAMFNTAHRIVLDQHEAEDVMQESFLTAFAQLPTLLDRSTFSAWLKRIVVNKSINALKARKTYEEVIDIWEPANDEGEMDYAPYNIQQVKEAIASLPDGYRSVLSLYLFEGYDHEEIGEIMGISSATSRSQFNRGKNRIKEILIQSA